MEYIPLNFNILRNPMNWLIVGLLMIFFVQAARALSLTPADNSAQ